MVSSQNLLSEERHKDTVPLTPGTTPVTARLGWAAADTETPQQVDVTAEETCPSAPAQMADDVPQAAPAIQAPSVVSEKTLELINQLDALAGDLAAGRHTPSDEPAGNVRDEPDVRAELPGMEPSIRVSPPPSSFQKDPFARRDKPPIGRRTMLTLAGCCAAALIGVAVASQSQRLWTPSSEISAGPTQERASSTGQAPSTTAVQQPVPVAQTASLAATPTPEVVKQLDAMAQDLAVVRRSLEQLSAKQEQLATAQQQLEQLTTKQEQLAGKQEQMAQNIAKLQAPEQNIRRRSSSPPTQARPAPIPPRVTQEPTAQVSSVPRPAPSHPVPPLPIPPP
ncbi:MAG TPA: hypothetical protein VFP79_03270 [Pseudolabrys sp.]|nr:hypothetical protein [Pseudolabrys sp.]